MKKFVLAASTLGLCALALVSCNQGTEQGGSTEQGGTLQKSKIGFIIAGNVGAEMEGFKTKWEEVAKQYNATLLFEQFKGQDPAYYKTCAENLIASEVDAIICNFEMKGKEEVGRICSKEKVYFGYSGSSLSDEQFKQFENNPYFVGQISPSAVVEEKAAYDMTKFYIEKYFDGKDDAALPEGTSGKFGVWPADFHGLQLEHQMTYRYKGMKKALKEFGVNVVGDENFDSSKWSATYEANCPEKLKNNVLFLGNNMADKNALIGQCSQIFAQKPSVVVTTCMGDFLLNMFATAGAKYGTLANGCEFGTIDGFTDSYDKWYTADANNPIPAFKFAHTPYIAGKYSSINVPMLALTIKAVNGQAVRDNGKAFSIEQNYLVATNKTEFEAAKKMSTEFSFTKAQLDGLTSVQAVKDLFASVKVQ